MIETETTTVIRSRQCSVDTVVGQNEGQEHAPQKSFAEPSSAISALDEITAVDTIAIE